MQQTEKETVEHPKRDTVKDSKHPRKLRDD